MTEINYAVFYNCKNILGQIALPSNITTIKDYAFYGCRQLQSIVLAKETKQISSSAFFNTPNFKIYKEDNNKYFNIYKGILYSNNMGTLYHCPNGYNAMCQIHKETKKITNNAFNGCSKIENIVLNNFFKILSYKLL